MNKAYVGLGSNIGDRIGYIQQAVKMLGEYEGVSIVKASSFYETEPYGVKEQNWFVNAVVELDVQVTPIELLRICQDIEQNLGRDRSAGYQKWGPRSIDLDVLLYNDEQIDDDLLIVPHLGTYDRAYCIVPMLEIARDLVHPVLNKTMSDVHSALKDVDEVYLYGTRPNEI